MSVSLPTGVQLVIFFCSNIPVVLFDTPVFSDNTLILLSTYLCLIKGIICDLFVARNGSRMS